MRDKQEHADYDYTKDVNIHLFDMHEGETKVQVVNNHGEDAAEVVVTRQGNQFTVKTTGLSGDLTVTVHENGQVHAYQLNNGEERFSI